MFSKHYVVKSESVVERTVEKVPKKYGSNIVSTSNNYEVDIQKVYLCLALTICGILNKSTSLGFGILLCNMGTMSILKNQTITRVL